jgi:hypothetical protein
MELLRKYGKEVFLVTKEMVADKPIFNNCVDEILIIENYMPKPKVETKDNGTAKTKKAPPKRDTKKIDAQVEELMRKVIDSFEFDSWQLVSFVGTKFHQMDKSRMINRSSYKSLSNLLTKLESEKLIKRRINDKGHPEVQRLVQKEE